MEPEADLSILKKGIPDPLPQHDPEAPLDPSVPHAPPREVRLDPEEKKVCCEFLSQNNSTAPSHSYSCKYNITFDKVFFNLFKASVAQRAALDSAGATRAAREGVRARVGALGAHLHVSLASAISDAVSSTCHLCISAHKSADYTVL